MTLSEFIRENADETLNITPEQSQLLETETDKATDFVFSKEFRNNVNKYNEEVWPELDELYTSFSPEMGLLVRVRLRSLRTEGDLILPNVDSIALPTKAGVGYADNIPNPYCYSKEAIIVAIPEHYNEDHFPIGARISINNKVRFVGKNAVDNNFDIEVNGAFVHPTADITKPPTDPLNRHYGYLIINPRDGELEGFLSKRSNKSEE